MKPGAGLVRLLAINALVLALLLALLAVLPPAAVDLYKLVRGGVADPRARLPIYDQLDWAAQHFEEFAALRTRYQDFIGWRRQPFAGTTITIDEAGYRRHPGGAGMNESEVWVFGGSAVWGPGVTDAGTIPARLQALSARPSFNFGEAAYTAHQSYNLLMKAYLLGGRPRQVVFYDGVNEVVHKCRAELGFYSTAQEAVIRDRLGGVTDGRSLLLEVYAPTLGVLQKLADKVWAPSATDPAALFDCHSDAAKTQRIAAALLQDWALAKALVESQGGRFLAVLQPVAHWGAPNLQHLDAVRNDTVLRQQYQAVYTEIQRQLAQSELKPLDLTGVHDGDERLYIDFCHVSPAGNERVARRIAAALQP